MESEYFYRLNEEGNAVIFHNDGTIATFLDEDVYPVGSDLSALFENPDGIVLEVLTAESIGIYEETLFNPVQAICGEFATEEVKALAQEIAASSVSIKECWIKTALQDSEKSKAIRKTVTFNLK